MGAILFLLAFAITPGAIRFANFKPPEGLTLVGDAQVSGKALRLTRSKTNRSGAVWLHEKQQVGSGFDTTFQFQLTKPGGLGHGADGFAFVIQNSGPDALGGRGSAGGFAVSDDTYHHKGGIPWSVAVFFDTFRNKEEGDPSANNITFRTHGRPDEMHWPADRLAVEPTLRVRLKDGNVHTARIVFQPPVLSVSLDGSQVLQAPVDLSIVIDPQGSAWVGFTASTGGGYENHDILNWSFSGAEVSSSMSVVSSQISFLMSACLPDRNLCTPERAVVEPTSTGYHVVLPANLEWGASIPNPAASAVEITDAHGIACWDVKARGSDGCSGPAGSVGHAGSGFLDPEAGAGALLIKSRGGHTWFSVNGRHDTARANEGFYEFYTTMK